MNKRIFILGAIGAAVVLLMANNKAKAQTGSGEILITNHDAAYDYRYSNGRWYTKRKTASEWTDMQQALSPENYQVAVNQLTAFLKA